MVVWSRTLLVVLLLCGTSLADKLDGLDHALDAYGDAYDKYEPERQHAEGLWKLYHAYWEPLAAQQKKARDAYDAANAAVAKYGKASPQTREATLDYKAQMDLIGPLERAAYQADPKQEATGPAVDRYLKMIEPDRAAAASTRDRVKAMFVEARKIGKDKAQKRAIEGELDKRLAAADERRARQAAATRGPQADRVYPSSGTSSGNHGGGIHPTLGPAFQQLQGGF
ncbi:MAG: hypothetical protein ACM31C_21365 [Acidobacteriota bacterium]